MNVKQSASVVWLIHSLEVLVVGAIFTVVLTVYQAFQAGHFDLASTGVTIGSLLVAFLGNGLKGIVYNANFAQGIEDLFNELFHRQQSAQPPIVINNHSAPVPVAPTPTPTPTFNPAASANFTTSINPQLANVSSVAQLPFPTYTGGTATPAPAMLTTLGSMPAAPKQ